MSKKTSIRVIEILDELADMCRKQQGDAAAMAFRNSVRAVCLEDGVCNCLEIGNAVHEVHWLIDIINRKLGVVPPVPVAKPATKRENFIDAVEDWFAANKTSISVNKLIDLLKAEDRKTQLLPPKGPCLSIVRETPSPFTGLRVYNAPGTGALTISAVVSPELPVPLPEPAPRPVEPCLPALPTEDRFTWPSILN